MTLSLLWFAVLFSAVVEGSYYLPGVTPQAYQPEENVKLFVNKLTSTKTQIPYDYYALSYCKPRRTGLQSENLGEVLSGERIENSVYKLEVKTSKTCEVACVRKLKKSEKEAFVRAIDDDYRVHWMVDNLPVGTFSSKKRSMSTELNDFERGFPVGFVENGQKVKLPVFDCSLIAGLLDLRIELCRVCMCVCRE
jgi:transmembrane 9 superfamily member 2/4